MRLMFLGTASNVGKTVITAAFCRYLSKKGHSVVPFKASNLSSKYVHTEDDGEIGIGQYIQSCACSKIPSSDMNPILFKPSDGRIITVVKGKECRSKDTEQLVGTAYDSFDRLSEMNDAVICEGSGSPVELNLMKKDIANLRMVRERSIPTVLVGDIEHGGVFASIYGTWLLIPEDIRQLVKGFIINRARCDPSVLRTGVERIEELTGMICLGVVPYVRLDLPEEDIGEGSKDMSPDNIRENLDKFLDICNIDLDLMSRISDP